MNKSNTKLFLKTLKQIGYTESETLSESDVHSMFSDKKLGPFLEVFCSLNEHNVLSTEEIQEYSSLTDAELAELVAIEKNSEHLQRSNTDECKKIDFHLLQEQLSHIEAQNRTMEGQIDLLKNYEETLLKKKESSQKLSLNAKKKFQMYEMSTIVQADSEFVSSLQSVLKQIKEMEELIMQSNAANSKLPSAVLFEETVQEYLKTEEKILVSLQMFLDKMFQFEGEDKMLSFVACQNAENEELLKESLFLQNSLKEQMLNKVVSESEVKKVDKFIKCMDSVQESSAFNCHPSQLSYKLEESIKLNEKLKKREEELNLYLSDAVSKNVDGQFSKIASTVEKKTNNCLQYAIKEMLLPMNTLICQRARLEMLIASLQEHKKAKLENIKSLIENAVNGIKQELSALDTRAINHGKNIKEAEPKQFGENPETSIYLSLYQILALPHELDVPGLSSVTLQEVLQKANKCLELKEGFDKKEKEKLQTIDLMEKQVDAMEVLLSGNDKNSTNWQEVEQSQNAELNKLCVNVASLEEKSAECNKEFDYKEQLLESKQNLSLARNLYIYALTNKELFKKFIDNIKEVAENSADYYLKS